MKRRCQIIIRSVTLLSLLLCVVTCVLWVRSNQTVLALQHYSPRGEWLLTVGDTQLTLLRHPTERQDSEGWDFNAVAADQRWNHGRRSSLIVLRVQRLLGLEWGSGL